MNVKWIGLIRREQEMDLSISLNGQPKKARIVFATRSTNFDFVRKWQDDLGLDKNPRRASAVELAQVAVYRYQAHAAIDILAFGSGQ